VRGAATAGPGVTGRLGTITRSDGPVQATDAPLGAEDAGG